jgi:hypothetical protein
MAAPTRSPSPLASPPSDRPAIAPARRAPTRGGNLERGSLEGRLQDAPKLAGMASSLRPCGVRIGAYACVHIHISYILYSLQHSSSWQTWLAEAPGTEGRPAVSGKAVIRASAASRVSQWFSDDSGGNGPRSAAAESRPHPSAPSFHWHGARLLLVEVRQGDKHSPGEDVGGSAVC